MGHMYINLLFSMHILYVIMSGYLFILIITWVTFHLLPFLNNVLNPAPMNNINRKHIRIELV